MLHDRYNRYRSLSLDVSLLRYGTFFKGNSHTKDEIYTAFLVMDKIADYYFYKMGTNNQ